MIDYVKTNFDNTNLKTQEYIQLLEMPIECSQNFEELLKKGIEFKKDCNLHQQVRFQANFFV